MDVLCPTGRRFVWNDVVVDIRGFEMIASLARDPQTPKELFEERCTM
jgi:hypothetical protein